MLLRHPSSSIVEHGTAIVALRTAAEIIIGADGKVNRAVKTSADERTCKIVQVGRVFVASAGIVVSARFGYDAMQMAHAAITEGGSINEMMDRYEDSVGNPLLEAAADFHDKDPNLFESMTGDGQALCTAFCGIENDIPTLIHSKFEITFSLEGDRLQVRRYALGSGEYLLWGHPKPMKEFLDEHPGYFAEVGDVNAVRHLLQLSIDDRPDMVGHPIAILRLSKEGAEWVVPSPCCPPIER